MTVGLLAGRRLGFLWGGGGGGGGLVWVCACQSATLLEITCHGSRFYYPILLYICALEIFCNIAAITIDRVQWEHWVSPKVGEHLVPTSDLIVPT